MSQSDLNELQLQSDSTSLTENVEDAKTHDINPYHESFKETLETASTSAKNRYPELLNAPKRKVAILLAYCGKNYYGLQCNRGDRELPTIEGKLFEALGKAKVVPEICVEKPTQMKYASASRTDKGVSTCGQVVSVKLRYNDKTADLINEQLPSDIRVMDIRRVTQGFHAKLKACGRTYSYTTPTFVFADVNKNNKKDYRINKETKETITKIMAKYKGTHSFHNFTSGKLMSDPSAKRYIINFWLEEPFIYKDMEFITLKITGQSFVMHQIRKMIGLLISMVTGYAKEDHFERAFTEPLTDIPKAPGTGLVLMKVHYNAYNKQYEHSHGNLEWESSQEKLKEFYTKFVMPIIYDEEVENKCMLSWLDTLPNHDYSGENSKIQWQEQVELWKNNNNKSTECNKVDHASNKIKNLKYNRDERLKRQNDNDNGKEDEENVKKIKN